MRFAITANATNEPLERTFDDAKTMNVFMSSTSNLDGGTFTLGIRDRSSNDDFMYISGLTPDGYTQLPCGNNVELAYTLSGGGGGIDIDLLVTKSS